MATYREIHGKAIKSLSTDPSLEVDAGQIWYNTSSNTFKSIVNLEAWISGSNMIAGKTEGGSLPHSPSTAGLAGGGSNPAGWTGSLNTTASWNGTGWSSEPNMNVARDGVRGDGSSTSALFVGGVRPPGATYSNEAESFNGSSWTAETAHPQAISQTSVAGVETAAVVAGGYDSAAAPSTGGRTRETFEYNGSSWTTGNNKPFGASNMGSAGVETASIFFGGFGQPGDGTAPPSPSSNPLNSAEEYDGTNWTTVSSLNTARYGVTGSGVQSDAGAIGGYPDIDNFERWDGSSWTNSATLATGRQTGFAGGSPASSDGAFIGGGQTPSITATTEKFHSSSLAYTAGAWASGGAMGTARTGLASAGTQTANVFIGGQMSNSPNADLNTVELYNGTTWSSNPNNAPYAASNNCGTGTQTAALSWGGYPNITTTLEFDGSSFTTTGALGTGRELTSNNIGVQTAAIAASGFQRPGTYPTQTEEYNGSSWTGGPVVNTPRYSAAGAGTTSAAVISGGIEPGQLSATEEYNGSSWTTVTARPFSAGNAGTSGTQTASLTYGGNPGSALTTTVSYDGTSWSTSPSMAQARAMMGSSAGGTSTAALASSGAAPTATEEFTGETTAVNVKTLTQS